jgi:hypothetical protein
MPDKAPNEPTMYPGLSIPAYYATDDGYPVRITSGLFSRTIQFQWNDYSGNHSF